MKKENETERKLHILILSCSTGGGHNAAGRAVEEYFKERGHAVDFPDYLSFAGKRVSDTVGNVYVKTVQKIPKVFGMVYKLGDTISNHVKRSPVYYANSLMAEYLEKCLQETSYDAIIVPHLFPAETLTRMKHKGMKLPVVIAIGTDYTCIPFWGETECDFYVVPSREVGKEFIQAGIPEEKILPYGIPVSSKYRKNRDEQNLSAPREGKQYLVAGGSMGAGNLVLLVKKLLELCGTKDRILVICGSNTRLYEEMNREFRQDVRVNIKGWTNQMAEYMGESDVIFTKPGGLTSTEAAVANCPIVHLDPIPGCETVNCDYFVRHGYSVSAKKIEEQAVEGVRLATDEKRLSEMRKRQKEDFPGDTAAKIEALIFARKKKL